VRGRLKTAVPVLLSISAAALLLLGVSQALERQRTSREIERLRGALFQARASADRCRGALINSEARLREFDDVIDDLRARVDSFETLDARGVPEDRYDAYLRTFEEYNDSAAAWETRAERLRTAEATCRATIERHNALSDSLRAVLSEAGLVPDEDAAP